ncbi:hypothetical protein IVA78_19345 [Bradyrhizobium sp. 137]|uniref:hypothetical protein n=1 Tax=Bradyrhizobium sp. 137 TaxID=2782614 RepID=UPI001FF7BFC0|nr:hypothetical protein [Bradyrhizobium sp. 137]MCK1757316.1 hypothetical protein [Bradyrhizobium sp. 137]
MRILAFLDVRRDGAPSRKNPAYMAYSGQPEQCWHTNEMAAIRWAYMDGSRLSAMAGFPDGRRLLNEPP